MDTYGRVYKTVTHMSEWKWRDRKNCTFHALCLTFVWKKSKADAARPEGLSDMLIEFCSILKSGMGFCQYTEIWGSKKVEKLRAGQTNYFRLLLDLKFL